MKPLDEHYVGIDLSTTTARCLILDGDLSAAGKGYARHTSLESGLAQNGDAWIAAVEAAFAAALDAAQISPRSVTSIGIATQGVTAVAVDQHGDPIEAPVGWLGNRGELSLSNTEISDWYRLSGRRLIPPFLAHRLQTNPSALSVPRWALAGDYVMHQLTDSWVIGPGLASTTGLVDPVQRDWSESLLLRAGIARNRLSLIGETSACTRSAVGPLSVQLGLSPETPVAFPTQDQRAAVLIADPECEMLTVTFGSAAAIVGHIDSGDVRLPFIPVSPGLDPDVWCLEGVVLAAGLAFDWGTRLIGASSVGGFLDTAYAVAERDDDVRFLPALAGGGSPQWDPEATGSLLGLDLDAGPELVARSIVDGVCTAIAQNVDKIAVPRTGIRLVGKAGAHPVVCETLSAMLESPIDVITIDEPTATGAALIGAHAAGHVDSLESAVKALPGRLLRSVEPAASGAVR